MVHSFKRLRGVAVVAAIAIAFSLPAASPAQAAGAGSISGTISVPLGFPGAELYLYDDNRQFVIGQSVSATPSGGGFEYSFENLEAGSYYVLMAPTANGLHNYSTVWHHATRDDVNLLSDADLVAVAEDEAVVGVDFTALAAGVVTGTASAPDGMGAFGSHYVVVWRESQTTGNWEIVTFYGPSVPDGGAPFSIIGIVPADYRFEYRSITPAYRFVFADGALTVDTATSYMVSTGTIFAPFTTLPDQSLTWAGPVENDRFFGSDRYATAIAISQLTASFAGAPGSTVYLAAGANFPDALSAAPAAAVQDAPLLLSLGTTLLSSVRAELVRLDPSRVVIAGGPSVISNAVKAAVESALPGAEVDRVFGADRYATSRALIEDAFPAYDGGAVFIATGANFPDALSAAAAAGYREAPVLLVPGTNASLSASTLAFIESMTPDTVYIAGGSSVVSAGIEAQLESSTQIAEVQRLAGADRFSTSTAINDAIFSPFVTAEEVYLAVGTGFADALAGAARAGADGSPLYVTPRTCVALALEQGIGRVGALEIRLLGGPSVLADSVATLTRCP